MFLNILRPPIYRDLIESWKPALGEFDGNETMASLGGFRSLRQSLAQGHDERSTIKDFVGWEVVTGMKLAYTTNYLLQDLRFYGAKRSFNTTGFEISKNVESVTLKDVDFSNFKIGVLLSKKFDSSSLLDKDVNTKDDHQYFFIDVDFKEVKTAYVNLDRNDHVLSSGAVQNQPLALTLDDDSLLITSSFPGTPQLTLSGIKRGQFGCGEIPSRKRDHRFIQSAHH